MVKNALAMLGIALISTAAIAASPNDRCEIQGGLGTGGYSGNPDSAVPISLLDFMATKYPRTIKTSKDLPGAISKGRISPFETTLWSVEAFVSCGTWNGPGLRLDLEMGTGINTITSSSMFGWPASGCRTKSPNAKQILTLERALFPWLESPGTGCGILNRWVRIIGYGFWQTEASTTFEGVTTLNAIPGIYPVVDAIVLDGPGGNPLPLPETDHPKFDLTVRSTAGDPVGGGKSYHATQDSGLLIVKPFSLGALSRGVDFTEFEMWADPAGPVGHWDISLSCVGVSDPCVPGFYANAMVPGAGQESFHRPGLGIFTYTNCKSLKNSSFRISNFVTDCSSIGHPAFSSDHIVQLEADFTAQCEEAAKGFMTGHLSYSADPGTQPCGEVSGGGGGGGGGGGTGGGTGGGGGGTGGDGGGDTGGSTPTPTPTPASTPLIVVPTNVQFNGVRLNNLESKSVTLSTAIPDGFNSDVALSAFSEPEGLTLSLSPSALPAPGGGTSVLKISAGADTRPQDYRVLLSITGGGLNSLNSIKVSVQCDPPFILGIDQPRNATIDRGARATLEVTPTGSAPIAYQWYAGQSGNTSNPIATATGRTFDTGPLTSSADYWVRATNPCGSVDSNSVTVTVR